VLAVREQLAEGRQRLREQHDRGLDGVHVCAKFTSQVDAAILRLSEGALEGLSEAEATSLRENVTLVAHGGYGRRQQAPYSDVDLMVLHQGRVDDLLTDLARRMTQDIFDVGVQLGQSLRTVSQAVQLSRTDAQIGTSLLESRYLLGSAAVYTEFSKAMQTMAGRRSTTLSRAFISARREERQHYGETVYLLEPNVKRSRGGLRDLHLLRWLWLLKFGVADPERLYNKELLSKFDYRRLVSAQNFLLRVRNEMHFHSGEPNDLLSRPEQLRLAEYFQFRGREGMRPVEQFMRDYFHHTNHIWHMVHRLSEQMQPASRVSRVLSPVFSRTTEDGYHIGRNEVSATPQATARLRQRLEEVLRLVDLARQEGKRIAQDTWYLVYRTAPQYGNDPSPEAIKLFLQILSNPERLGELLRRLHELGVLEKIIPDFSHVRSLLQFNQYHKYTVDEHCIRAVEEATYFAERQDTLGDLYRRLKSKRTLHLALLLHDLGKGFEEDHSVVGRRIAERVGQRLELPPEEVAELEFLVFQHLLMSHLALRHDTSQPRLVTRFADEVNSQSLLDMLLMVTCADLAAVGPGVLNSWKVEVLTDLHFRASTRLSVERSSQLQERRDTARSKVCRLLMPEEQTDPWFERQLDALPDGYVVGRPAENVCETLRRLRQLTPQTGMAWGQYQPDTDTIEFFAGIDQGSGRGIFSSMAGTLTSCGMQILFAETNLVADGLLLLRYVVQDPDYPGETPAERIDKLERALVESIDSDQPPTFRQVWGREQKEANAALSDLPNEVRIDSDLADEYSIVEVFTIDRRGLLYRLARTLHDLELVIRFAKIGTYLDQVVDVFYVTEREGGKPQSGERLDQIRAALTAVITSES
jgi:[protein-PII] uridylyltransferase